MSPDFTQGYGPEEFMLKRALPGKYVIKVNYYGNTQQILAGATTIQVMLITDFGRENEQQKAITLRLKEKEEVVEVGEFEFTAKKP
jgi:Ca-activated chloride channel family protein